MKQRETQASMWGEREGEEERRDKEFEKLKATEDQLCREAKL